MGNLITFEKRKKRKEEFNQNKKKSKIATEKATKGCPKVLDSLKEGSSIDIDYADMEPEQKIEFWKNMKNEKEERFREKYKDVLAAVPVSAGERMQYFSNVMLHLLPDVFHGSNWDERFDACADFCEFYISEFDPAYSDYIRENKEFEKEYQYKFGTMKTEKLEEELKKCLTKIVEISPEKKEEDKTEMLYQSARLFELDEILLVLFCEELMKE